MIIHFTRGLPVICVASLWSLDQVVYLAVAFALRSVVIFFKFNITLYNVMCCKLVRIPNFFNTFHL